MMTFLVIVALLFEFLSILCCLSYCYGQEFRIDKITGAFIVIEVTFITIIYIFDLQFVISFIMYILFAIYCGIKYGWKWKEIFINYLLTLLIIGIVQMFLMITASFLSISSYNAETIRLIETIIMFIIIYCLKKAKLYEVSHFILSNAKIFSIITGIGVFAVLFSLVMYKVYRRMELNENLFIFLYIMIGFTILAFWQHSRIKQVEINAERQCYDKYSKTYEELIDVVRMRQHEFDNQLNSIISLHYTKNTYEELVEAQQEYISAIKIENRYNKLLKDGNPFFIGFIYGKFQNLSKSGIKIDYKIKVDQLDRCGIPVYKLIEVANDLITNAADALELFEDKELYVEAIETDEEIIFEVRNIGEPLQPDYIERCFEKGFSSKGSGRGYGLYNVKTICNRYHIDILFENMYFKNKNWICFKIRKKNCTD